MLIALPLISPLNLNSMARIRNFLRIRKCSLMGKGGFLHNIQFVELCCQYNPEICDLFSADDNLF